MLNALTFDVEDYFHVHAFEGVVPRETWDGFPTRVVENTRLILRLLRENSTLATFFVLGWVAERHPEIVQEIAADGHELASHGYGHESVHRIGQNAFRRDVVKSLDALHTAVPHTRIQGYRAPSFSINAEASWAFDVLESLGFAYDSSMFPVSFHDRYAAHGAPRFAHIVGKGLFEFPLSTIRAFRCNWPVAGGGYFRLSPLSFTNWAISQINRGGQPAIVYLHPWEFDPAQPRVLGTSLRSRFRHYVNLHRTEMRLRALLQKSSFGPINRVFQQQLSQARSGIIKNEVTRPPS
jgi:polysaccharide deacetylase family protein (PEP-CTERM system associated)